MKQDANRNEHIHRKRRLLWKIGFFTGFLMVLFFVLQAFKVDLVIVEGNTHYTDGEMIAKMMTEPTDDISFLFVLRHMFQETEIPFVEKTDTEMLNRSTIKIYVYEKAVVGCIEVMNVYMYFDREGIIVESSAQYIQGIPIIKGLTYQKVILHEKLETQSDSLFDKIMNLTGLLKKYDISVNEIEFFDNMEIKLNCDTMVVLLAKRDRYEEDIGTLKSLQNVYDGKKLEVDMRHDEIIAKPLT